MDIIFFAAIALFVALKLREQFGKISDSDKDKIAKQVQSRQERIVRLQNTIQEQLENSSKEEAKQKASSATQQIETLAKLDDKAKATLNEILEKQKITLEFFLNGTKSAFEMVIKAFAQKDIRVLKFLLEEKIFEGFNKAIEERKAQNKNLNTNLISIDKTEILSAKIEQNQALVTIKFSSKQINYFTNDGGEIIEGRKDNIAQLSDVWTFKKNLDDQNPNWKISATS